MRASRGAPQFEAGHPAEYEQRLAKGTGGALHERPLSSLHAGRPVKELVCGRPAQDQHGRLCRVDARRHAGQVAGAERAIGRVRANHRQIGHTLAKLKVAHALAELIDFSDDIVARTKGSRRAAVCA